MDTLAQEAFLRTIRSALKHLNLAQRGGEDLLSSKFTIEISELIDRVKNRNKNGRLQLLDRLVESAKPIHLHVIPLKDIAAVGAAIAELVRTNDPEWGNQKRVAAWKHPLLDRLNLPAILAALEVPLYVSEFGNPEPAESVQRKERDRLRRQIIDSYIGVTSADFCLADTATLVMRTRPGLARSVSLLPSIHVAVITLDQVIANLKELYILLKWDPEVKKSGLSNCMTFISGPSKTADIEASMVQGAHGPRGVYIYVITEEATQHCRT
jgi:L-lactate dehydrogenase complex protein LldG